MSGKLELTGVFHASICQLNLCAISQFFSVTSKQSISGLEIYLLRQNVATNIAFFITRFHMHQSIVYDKIKLWFF